MNRKSTADDSETFAMNSWMLFFGPERAIPSPWRAADDRESLADDCSRAFVDYWRLLNDSRSTADDSQSLAANRSLLADDSKLLAHDSFRSFHDFRRTTELPSPQNKDISNQTRAKTKAEGIIMSTPSKSIHRATIALDVPAKIADVILYATTSRRR